MSEPVKLTPQQKQFLEFYETYRRGAQSKWYRNRYETYEAAHRQSVTLTTLVLFLSSAASILSVEWESPRIWPGVTLYWPVVAAVLTATGTAIAAYRSLYGFQENSRVFRDADNSLAAVLADSPVECENCPEAAIRSPADYIPRVEEIFRREQSQWGQLVAQIRAVTVPGGEKEGGGDTGLGGGPVGGGGGGSSRGAGGPAGGGGGGGKAPVEPVVVVVPGDAEVDAASTVAPPAETDIPEEEEPDPPPPTAPGDAVG